MSGTILNFKLYSVLFCVPAACVVGYLIFKKDLMKSGIILAFCLVVSGIFLYYVLSANFNARKNDDNNVDLDDRSLEEILASLQQQSATIKESCMTMEILKKKIEKNRQRRERHKNEHIMEIDLVKMGLVKHLLSVLDNSVPTEEMTISHVLELINAVISETQARDELFDTMANLKSTVDIYCNFMKRWFAATTDSNSPKLEKLRLKVVVMVCIAMTLMAIHCPAAQTRIGDKGGVVFLHSIILSKEFFCKPQVVLIATGCLLTLTSDHPPNKGELFRIGAIATLNNILNRYLNNVEVCSYSLKLLHNLLADDVQAKHSIGKAREVCFQLQMTDLILKIRRNFFNNDHILLVSKEILKLIASNFA